MSGVTCDVECIHWLTFVMNVIMSNFNKVRVLRATEKTASQMFQIAETPTASLITT